MVFLCMLEEIEPLDSDPRYAELAKKMTVRALLHVKHERRLVFEHVGPRGELIDSPAGRLLNPGHAIELAWLLLHRARRTGETQLMRTALDVIDWSLAAGWDKTYGGLLYFLDADGRPPTKLEWSMKLWWPMTEALYALLLAHAVSGKKKYMTWHAKVHDWAFEHFRDSRYGEWYGYLDRQGVPTHQLKGGEWKGFFHLPRALWYSIQLLEHAEPGAPGKARAR